MRTGTTMTGTKMTGTRMASTRMAGMTMTGTKMSGTTMSGTTMNGTMITMNGIKTEPTFTDNTILQKIKRLQLFKDKNRNIRSLLEIGCRLK